MNGFDNCEARLSMNAELSPFQLQLEAFHRDLFIQCKHEELRNLIMLSKVAAVIVKKDGIEWKYESKVEEKIQKVKNELALYIKQKYHSLIYDEGE